MKFRAARIRNFKLLRSVELAFSVDGARPLTVIRAENASGKTSLMAALEWALYGGASLEDTKIRLSPADWKDNEVCEVSVEIDFERTVYNQIAGTQQAKTTGYRLVRAVAETPNGNTVTREPDRLSLFELTTKGASAISAPDQLVSEMLPTEMKEIFFTDGDRAMNFISAQLAKSTKRDQVRDAIRSLLGLTLLEAAGRHLKEVERRLVGQMGSGAGNSATAQLTKRLQDAEERLETVGTEGGTVGRGIENLSGQLEGADRALEKALQLGNYEELAARMERAKKQLAEVARFEFEVKRDHRDLFEMESLSWGLLDKPLRRAHEVLNGLKQRGVIPKASIPVLQERLEEGECICGASLEDGSQARRNVETLIEAQRAVDKDREALTRLLHMTRNKVEERDAGQQDWPKSLGTVERARLRAITERETAERDLAACEEKLKQIDRADVEDKRKHRDALRIALTAQQDKKRNLEIELRGLIKQVDDLRVQLDAIAKADAKYAAIEARTRATRDIMSVVQKSISELQGVYLRRVSDKMNELFLEMIGADPEAGSVFQAARITPEYEIEVHTFGGKTLNPDHEVNGASKRALTFAFIWALTEVSGVAAPRVIDTPLGMMAGAVKRRTLEMVSQGSGTTELQVILLLTRSEIAHTEDIIDGRAGAVATLTNTTHYPRDLVNEPKSDGPRIVTCSCTHRQVCRVCQRCDDAQYGFTMRE